MKQRSTPRAHHTALSGNQGKHERVTALSDLQRLFSQYSAVVEQAKEDISSSESLQEATWPTEAEVLLETVEAYLRARRQEKLSEEPVTRDDRTGFFLDTTDRCWLSFEDLLCEITVLFGMRGAGKSNTVAYVLEQLLRRGVPMAIIDPHGEYGSLRALSVPLLVVGVTGGKASAPDLVVDPASIGTVATFSVREGVSVILDLTGLKKKLRYDVLTEFFEALWTVLPDMEVRRPYHLVLEEAHSYIPEGSASPVSDIVADLVTEYRKFGLGGLIIDQRPARVRKTPITQARVRILHGVEDPLDVARYKETVPRRAKQMEALLDTFIPGTALVKNRRQIDVIQVKQRETAHLGATPTLDGVRPHDIEIVRNGMLVAHLQEALAAAPPCEHRDEMSLAAARRLQETIDRLAEAEHRSSRLSQENTFLREQIAGLLGRLQTAGLVETTEVQFSASPLAGKSDAVVLPSALDIAEARIAHVEITQMADSDNSTERSVNELLARLAATRERNAELSRELEEAQQAVQQLQKQITLLGAQSSVLPNTSPALNGESTTQALAASGPIGQLRYSEKKLLKKLIEQVANLSSTEKVLFIWLLEHDGQEINSKLLADSVGMDVRVTWTGVTRNLVKIPFISRWNAKMFWFKSSFSVYASRNFASVSDQQAVAQQLLEAAQEKG
jgi:hypothetical protein